MSTYTTLNPFDLKANPWNSNKVDRVAFEKLKKSLVRHGSFKPITVRTLPDGTKQILGGFHRTEAAKELGWKEIPVYDLGDIPDDRAKEITLIDNTRYGIDDAELLQKLLDDLGDLEALASIMPETTEIELPELEDSTAKVEEEIKERTEPDETHKVLKFKLEIDKAEEIETVLSRIAYDKGYKFSDGYANFNDALYHALIIDGK
jgi:ParB family chromosome partitioning protein